MKCPSTIELRPRKTFLPGKFTRELCGSPGSRGRVEASGRDTIPRPGEPGGARPSLNGRPASTFSDERRSAVLNRLQSALALFPRLLQAAARPGFLKPIQLATALLHDLWWSALPTGPQPPA